jgi:HAD superfamily hydrolase (TIGR01509 family)
MFDCYGVLVGTGYWSIYSSLGGDLVKDKQFVDDGLNELNFEIIGGSEFAKRMSARLGVTVQEHSRAITEDELLNEDVFNLISTLKKNYRLALATNATASSVRAKIPEDKLSMFDTHVVSGDIGLVKPDPRFFAHALRMQDLAPEEAVFVDDNQDYVNAAMSCGLHAVLYVDTKSLYDELRAMGVELTNE